MAKQDKKTVEVSFSVVSVSFEEPKVTILIRRLNEEKGSITRKPVIINPLLTEDENIAMRMADATFQTIATRFGPERTPILVLTWEEYEKLGKPTVNDVIHVTLEGDGDGADASR